MSHRHPLHDRNFQYQSHLIHNQSEASQLHYIPHYPTKCVLYLPQSGHSYALFPRNILVDYTQQLHQYHPTCVIMIIQANLMLYKFSISQHILIIMFLVLSHLQVITNSSPLSIMINLDTPTVIIITTNQPQI